MENEEKRVYWISTFGSKFEDSMVKLVSQYKGAENHIDSINNIDCALGVCNHAREAIKSKPDFVFITMIFKMVDEKLEYGPDFNVFEISDKNYLKRNDYIFVGFAENTDKEKYKITLDAEKFNL